MNEYAVRAAIGPLRTIFWGGLLCVLDFNISQTSNGRGFTFDILNDALGAFLIAVSVFRLATIPVHRRYAAAMRFVLIVSVLALLDAIRAHFVMPLSPAVQVVIYIVGLATMAAIVTFCVAMRWFCEEAYLFQASRSWSLTTKLFILIYLLPLGLLYVMSVGAIFGGRSFNFNIGAEALLLLVVFAIPIIHLFISTSRMKHAAQAVGVVLHAH